MVRLTGCTVARELDVDDCDSCLDVGIEEGTVVSVIAPAVNEGSFYYTDTLLIYMHIYVYNVSVRTRQIDK
jgi:hypothetical protein